MYRLATFAVRSLWTAGLLGCLAVGVQPTGFFSTIQASPIADQAPETVPQNEQRPQVEDRQVREQPGSIPSFIAEEPMPSNGVASPVQYGPDAQFAPYRPMVDPYAKYKTPPPRRKFTYREPTCMPSRAQIAWAKALPNHSGLAQRGLTDEQIVEYFAPSEVKALEGEEVPDHLRPDNKPAVVFINQRCKDGTCVTGYCQASRNNVNCVGDVCRARQR